MPAASGPLKIVHVTRQFHPYRGGLEDFVANLAREQVRAGHDVRVVTCDRLFVDLATRLPRQDVLDGIRIARIPFRGSTRYPVAPAVLGEIAGADLVHVHAVDFFYDFLAWTRPLHRRPLVATTHGGFFHTNAGSRLKRLWFNGPTRISSRAYGAVVACSEPDARLFAPVAGNRVRLIENGVDLGKYGRPVRGAPAKSLVALGRFSSNKRLDRVLDAAAVLVARDPAWRLAIIGSPSDWDGARVAAEAAGRGIGPQVEVLTGLDDARVAERLRQASIFLSASEYEGFGIALIEAMGAGLAPVVQPNASFAELARRHPAIRLCDFADPVAAADAVEAAFAALAASPGRPVAGLDRYSWESVGRRYEEVYRAAVLGRPAARMALAPASARG